jgi:hypothetical protein
MNIFESSIKLPPCKEVKIRVTRDNFRKSRNNDALLSPIALALKKFIRKDCDVLATSKQILFYDRKFDRKNTDIVLGLGRIATINIPEDISKMVRDYENSGKEIILNFNCLIPESILDESKR